MARGPLLAAAHRLPGGTLTVVVDPHAVGDLGITDYGAVVASTFGDLDEVVARLDPGSQPVHPRSPVPFVRETLERYAAGEVDALDAISVVQPGAQFQQRAWAAMRQVPAGSVITYAELAERAGSPRADRAAGNACATNAVPVIVPCHRIVASDGLGGYAFGLDVKVALLEHEGVLL